MVDNFELPNSGRISGTLHLDSGRRARMMQTQAGVAETLKLRLEEKRRATDLLPPTERA